MHNGGKEKEGQALGKNSLFRTCCVSTGMQPTEAGPHSALLTQLLLTWKWKRRFSRFSTNHRKRGNVCTGCWSLDRPVCDRSCVRSRSFARLSLYSFFLPFFLSFFFFFVSPAIVRPEYRFPPRQNSHRHSVSSPTLFKFSRCSIFAYTECSSR